MEFIIVLDKPQMGENIGAAARVMANFGIEELRIVNPRDGWPNETASYMATCGSYIIENAKIYTDLKEAISDADYVIGTMGRDLSDFSKPIYTPRYLNKLLGFKKVVIIFGCERVGLNNEELSLCSAVLTIDTKEKCKSMNLAQAVAVICYEISQINIDTYKLKHEIDGEIATQTEVSEMLQHLEDELTRKNFFQEPSKKPRMMINIRNMFNRNIFSKQEVRTLRGIIRTLSKDN
ncbi:MAG: RNA methyltransferase [Sphingobacteriia bacterium]|nr:RNA methyltransferase [Sphingobacteriia bacterium]